MARSIFSDEKWNEEIGPRYVTEVDTPARVIAAELEISPNTLCSQMKRRGFQRRRARRAPSAAQTTPGRTTRSEQLGFVWDPENPEAALNDLAERGASAALDGRLPEFREILRCRTAVRVDAGLGRTGGKVEGEAPEALDAEIMDDPALLLAPPVILRPAQTPPPGDWSTWLFLGGRGAGKTLAGASWLADRAEKAGRLALVGATLHDVREVMIGGPSGVAALPRWRGGERPVYEPTRRRLAFPNGAQAFAFSAEDPDSLRGPQFAAAWADEFCAWARPEETLAMLRLGLRLGEDPRLVVTTTPRPLAALGALRGEPGCATTHAPTRENLDHLAPGFLERLKALYGGTRREQQELEGLMIEAEGGLFRAEDLARARSGPEARPARFDRVVVGVDPTTTPGGDACGIVAAGRVGERAWVLADRSRRGLSPDAWARRAIAALDEFGAQAVVAEVNQGGDMVSHVLKTQRPGLTVREVRATRGKRLRAEPVAALYEQGRVTHLGTFRELEEELMTLGTDEAGSLDRADALVWALTDLMLGTRGEGPRIRRL